MEAEAVDELPQGEGWQYEPKYDGFRAVSPSKGMTRSICSQKTKSRLSATFQRS